NSSYNNEPERTKAVNVANLGQAYEKTGRYKEAIELYKQAVAVTTNPEFHEISHGTNTLLQLGNTYLKINKTDEAKKCLDEARVLIDRYGLHELNETYYLYYSGYFEKKGDFKSAFSFF